MIQRTSDLLDALTVDEREEKTVLVKRIEALKDRVTRDAMELKAVKNRVKEQDGIIAEKDKRIRKMTGQLKNMSNQLSQARSSLKRRKKTSKTSESHVWQAEAVRLLSDNRELQQLVCDLWLVVNEQISVTEREAFKRRMQELDVLEDA